MSYYKHKRDYRQSRNGGFLSLIGLFIIFSGLMWYFKIDVRGFIDSHAEIKNFFVAGKDMIISLFKNYFSPVLSYLWNNIWVDIVWKHIKGLIVPV